MVHDKVQFVCIGLENDSCNPLVTVKCQFQARIFNSRRSFSNVWKIMHINTSLLYFLEAIFWDFRTAWEIILSTSAWRKTLLLLPMFKPILRGMEKEKSDGEWLVAHTFHGTFQTGSSSKVFLIEFITSIRYTNSSRRQFVETFPCKYWELKTWTPLLVLVVPNQIHTYLPVWIIQNNKFSEQFLDAPL